MDVMLSSTSKLVEVEVAGVRVPARVWEGYTAAGIPVVALVTRIAAERAADLAEFERDLAEQRPPTPAAAAFPARMVL